MTSTQTEQQSPDEIDGDLASVVYGERCHELTSFFFRRTQSPEIAAALLAETFATAAQIRMKRPERSAHDQEWLTSIATLELSRYFRAGHPASKAVEALNMAVPALTGVELAQLRSELTDKSIKRPMAATIDELILS